jgi:hypothetical protein
MEAALLAKVKEDRAGLFLRNLAVNMTGRTTAPLCYHACLWNIRSLLHNGILVLQRLDIFLMKNGYSIISMLISGTVYGKQQ